MEDIVVSSGYRKTMSFLTLFSIFFQTFLPLLLNPIPSSFAVDSLKTTVRYDQNTHNITIGVNTTNDLNYQLIYKTDTKIDGIVGSGTELTNIFSKDIYVGTCSDTECVPDNPLRGILKVEVPQSNWLNALYFTVSDGNISVEQDITPSDFDLTDDENKWIETGKSSIPPPVDTVVPQICSSPTDTIVDSPDSLWTIDVQNKTAVTTGKVKLGVRYTFPLEKKVSVTFKCLPTNESLRTPLKIEQIDISALKLPDTVNPADKFAYDITTGMTDGQFEYDLTLQKSPDSVAGVVYMEDNLSDIKTLNTSDITQETDTVKVTNLNHFTIFYVLKTYSDTSLTIENTDYIQGDTVFVKGTRYEPIYKLKIRIVNPDGTTKKECISTNSNTVICDYQLPSDAPIGSWKAQIARCSNFCNLSSSWNWDDSDPSKNSKFNVALACDSTYTYSTIVSNFSSPEINVVYSDDQNHKGSDEDGYYKISVSSQVGYEIKEIWLDVNDDNETGYHLYQNGPLLNFDPNPGKQIYKAKVVVKRVCTPVEICGDGIKNTTEECDDGNTEGKDGCSGVCAQDYGWYCLGEPSVCNTECGDGRIAGSEVCDDDNKNNNDGCSSVCVPEAGWTCNSSEPSSCTRIDSDSDGDPDIADCDDDDPLINHSATEICDNKDNDCDGETDEGVTTTYYRDSDTDMYGDPGLFTYTCSPPAGYVSDNTDCNDANATIHPGAAETPNDGIDQDCNGFDTITCYIDSDKDTYGSASTVLAPDETCDTVQSESTNKNDCNDTNFAVNPGATEVCGDSVDNNCDSKVDEGCAVCGNNIKEGTEECDVTDGVTAGQNFCSASCHLISIYNGQDSCPAGTSKSQNPVATYDISGTDADGVSFTLTSGGKYLFEASGIFVPTSPAGWFADAGYTTNNNWGSLATQYGIQGTGDDYAAHALLANLGNGVGVVNWNQYNPDHVYAKYYEPTSSTIQFLIGDRYGDWFDTFWKNQTGMTDNAGSLKLDVYECQPTPTNTPTLTPTQTPTSTPTPPTCTDGAGWASVVVSSNQGKRKNGISITDPTRTNPVKATLASDNVFYSLGYGGQIILSFSGFVIDQPNSNDLSFHEVTNGRSTYPVEKIEVSVSQNGDDWISLGEVDNKAGGNGIGYKDLAGTGLSWIKYVRVTDTTNDSRLEATADGYDLDAVDMVNQTCQEPQVPTSIPTQTPTPTTVPAEIWWYKIDANLAPEDSVGGHIVTPDTWEMTVNDQVGPKNTNISSVEAYNNPGTYNHIDVSPGRYSLAEVSQDGWNLAWGRCQDSTNGVPSGWNSNIDVDQDIAGIQQVFGPDAPTSSSDYGPLGVTANNYADVNLVSGQRIYCVFYNQRFVPTPTPIPNGSLTVYKYHDLDANGTKDDNDPSLPEWDIVVDKVGSEGLTQKTDESGKTTFTLNTGDYNLYENITSGWYQSNISCSVKGSYDSSTQKYSLTVDPGADITCYIGNYQQSTITVDKNVFNYKDKDVMDNKTFTVTGDNGLGSKSFSEQSNAVFTVKPGTYTFTEGTDKKYTIKSIVGDENSSITGAQITVNSGDQKSLTFNNQKVKPKFTIHKFNNRWPFNLSPGGQIIYTLVINVLDSDIFDAVVTDLPPFGFKYQSGSYQVTVNGAPRSIPEPVYSSPGKWYVGDLSADDEVVLTYTANIDSSVDSGLYKDIAWAYGCTDSTECTPQSDDKLLAQAVDSGKIDTGVLTNSYVGSKISLDTNSADSSSKDINVVKEDSSTGQVLGATTELPSTGANGWWLLISFLLTTFGMTLIFGKKIINLIFIIAFGLFLFTPISALAVQSDTIFIRLEDPQSPTNKSQFNLDFTAIDQLNRPLTVKCFVIKPDNSTIQMGDDILVKAGGNSGQCLWGSFSQSESGQTYKYYAVASADSESYQSDQALVIYDNSSPSTPENYAKEKINNCQYKIKFKASNDGQSNIIRVYRSDQTSFIADSGSQVGEVGISPNQEGSYTDIISSNCLKDYYYVIRAFDTSGNGSDTTGDSVVTIKSTSTSTSSSVVLTTIQKTAIPVTNVTLPPEPEITIVEEEPVISLEPTSAPEEGAVLGQETDNAKISTKTKTIVIITLIIVGILMVVVYRLKKRFRT